MKSTKKILAFAAAAALVSGVSAFAANPFSDVSTNDWAYQAVSDLSDQGVVEGYPDGTFKGERNITRYELAQIIARLMAKEDQLNAEQRETLDKLAGEYADELANLGVRVANLEKKAGNIYWSGDARMRYQTKDNTYKYDDETQKSVQASDNWDGRMRIAAKAVVNGSTYVKGQFDAEMNYKGAPGDKSDGDVTMDQIFVNHDFGSGFSARLGRQPITFGDQGGWLYGDHRGIDGAQLAYKNGGFDAKVGYGRFNASDSDLGYKDVRTTYAADKQDVRDMDALYAEAGYNFNKSGRVAASYINFAGKDTYGDAKKDRPEVYGLSAKIPVADTWSVFGEYWKNPTSDKFDDAYNAGLGYSTFNTKKPGTFSLGVAYNNIDRNVYFGGSGLQTDVFGAFGADGRDATNVKFWNVLGDVTLQKNVYLHGEYAFNVKSDKGEDAADNAKDHDAWTVSLNYIF